MISTVRKLALPLVLSGALASVFGGEVVLQNGVNGYNGCADATISHGGSIPIPDNNEIWGAPDVNFDSLPYLHANFCPT